MLKLIKRFVSAVVISAFITTAAAAESLFDIMAGKTDGWGLVLGIVVMTSWFLIGMYVHYMYTVPRRKQKRILSEVRWDSYMHEDY